MSINSVNLKYPVYDSTFISRSQALVGGGGGEGNHGIPNKLTLIDTDNASSSGQLIEKEIRFEGSTDNPTCFDFNPKTKEVLVSINGNLQSVKSKENFGHFKVLPFLTNTPKAEITLFNNGDIDIYTKTIIAGVGSKNFTIVANNTNSIILLDSSYKIEYTHVTNKPSDVINNVDYLDEIILYTTSSGALVLLELESGIELLHLDVARIKYGKILPNKSILLVTDDGNNYIFRKLHFSFSEKKDKITIDNTNTENLRSIKKSKVTEKLTNFDYAKYGSSEIVVLSNNLNDIIILDLTSDSSEYIKIPQHHAFPITTLSTNAEFTNGKGLQIVSGSFDHEAKIIDYDNLVEAEKFEKKYTVSNSGLDFKSLLLILGVLILLLAVLVRFMSGTDTQVNSKVTSSHAESAETQTLIEVIETVYSLNDKGVKVSVTEHTTYNTV